jgi:hypothetical protein
MAEKIEKSLLELDFASLTRRAFTPSPAAWEDQILYFLLLDRFSDGKENGGYQDNEGRAVSGGVTPRYRPEDAGRVEYETWFRAGGGWQGGTLGGLRSKLGYLRRLGITALWVSPVFRQVAFEPSYHGYGIQNFLDVDPHFGTREEFRDFVRAAHEQGISVILDIIAHHTGNVFSYDPDRYRTHDPASGRWDYDPRWDGKPYAVKGFNDRDGRPTLPFATADGDRREQSWPDGAVWPTSSSTTGRSRDSTVVGVPAARTWSCGRTCSAAASAAWVRRGGTSSTRTATCTGPWRRSPTYAGSCCRCGGAGRPCTKSPGTAFTSACRAAWASGCARWWPGPASSPIRKSWWR